VRHLKTITRVRIMEQRIDYAKVATGALAAMMNLERYVRECGLEHSLLHLLKLRASQINGCAYCIDMHSKDALAAGETPQRLLALSAWPETPFFTDRERAALAWAEGLTLVSSHGAPDAFYQAAREHFSEKELVDLTMAVVAINGWNRLAITFRPPVGTYQPGRAA
jgi:AhpD family alkylhydroperoxidase